MALQDQQLVQATVSLTKMDQFQCPVCYQTVRLKIGDKVRPYFAHINQTCEYQTLSEAESLDHLSGKLGLQTILAQEGEVFLEVVMPEIEQRADLVLENWLVIEYQCSPITRSEIERRTQKYRQLKYEVLWIFGPKFYQQKTTHAKLDKIREKGEIAYYLPKLDKLIVHNNFKGRDFEKIVYDEKVHERISSLKVYGHHDFLNSDSLALINAEVSQRLAQNVINKENLREALPSRVIEKQAFKIAQNIIRKNNDWVEIQTMCYQNGVNIIGIPWYAHEYELLPIVIKEKQIIWRARLLLALSKLEIGTTFNFVECYQFFKASCQIMAAEDEMEREIVACVHQFYRRLCVAGIFKTQNGLIQLVAYPKWYPNLASKLAALKDSY